MQINCTVVYLWTKDMLGHAILSFVERLSVLQEVQNVITTLENDFEVCPWVFLLCPLLGGSFIGGSTVIQCVQ